MNWNELIHLCGWLHITVLTGLIRTQHVKYQCEIRIFDSPMIATQKKNLVYDNKSWVLLSHFNEVSVLTVKIILCYTKRGANRGGGQLRMKMCVELVENDNNLRSIMMDYSLCRKEYFRNDSYLGITFKLNSNTHVTNI
jgi:hypothetical protein